MKSNFGFVLVKPQIGENIGSSARSLKNFGFGNLKIVSPRQSWPNSKAKATSVGAHDIIKKTKIYSNVIDAISEFNIVFSLSARKRDINKKHISMEEFLKIISSNKKLKYGLMFGPEASGLSNYDLSFSNYILQIPTSKKFRSMNLSHSLTIICYEIFKLFNKAKFSKISKNLKLATKKEINEVISYLKILLEGKNFFKPAEKKTSMVLNINNLFYKLQPNVKELRVLASIISSLYKEKSKRN